MSTDRAALAGKVCLLTGASSGIGQETALALARADARVVLLCRDPERGEAARRAIRSETGNTRIDLVRVDVASLASVRKAGAARDDAAAQRLWEVSAKLTGLDPGARARVRSEPLWPAAPHPRR